MSKYAITIICILCVIMLYCKMKNIKILPEESKQKLKLEPIINLKTTFTDTLTDIDNDTNTGYNYENNSNTNIETYNTSNPFPNDFILNPQHLFKKDFPELNHNGIFYGSRCMYCGKISHFSERLFNYGEAIDANDFFYSNGKHPRNYEIIHCEYCERNLDLTDIYLNRFKIIWE
jgi:hypothetical protein